MAKVGIINCGISNLTSVFNALNFLSVKCEIVNDPVLLDGFSHLILPGVGAFPKGMHNLTVNGFDEAIARSVARGKPLLGICLGMQLFALEGEEFRRTKGLGLISGRVTKIKLNSSAFKLPHVGWNSVAFSRPSPLWKSIPDDSAFYFVHSYVYSDLQEDFVIGETNYDNNIIAAVARENVYGVQFHPEKSQKVGLQLLKNFSSIS